MDDDLDLLASLARAFAKYYLPAIGVPNNNIPFQENRFSVNQWGNQIDKMIASINATFDPFNPAKSSYLMFSLLIKIALYKLLCIFLFSRSPSISSVTIFLLS